MKKIKIRNIIYPLLVVFFIILFFTVADYFVHALSKEYSVPSYYFRNKIIFGIIIGSIAYFFVRKLTPLPKALIFSAVISILLQTRYFLSGLYTLEFVFEFLVFHFPILFVVSLVFFKYTYKNIRY